MGIEGIEVLFVRMLAMSASETLWYVLASEMLWYYLKPEHKLMLHTSCLSVVFTQLSDVFITEALEITSHCTVFVL